MLSLFFPNPTFVYISQILLLRSVSQRNIDFNMVGDIKEFI